MHDLKLICHIILCSTLLTCMVHAKNRFLKGQLISEWIFEVIVSPKIQTKNYQDFCPHYRSVNFEMVFWGQQFPPKNKPTSLTLQLWYLRLTCFCSFFGGNRQPPKPFRNKLTFPQGRHPDNFLCVFWNKQWLPKFILKITDLYASDWFWRQQGNEVEFFGLSTL